MTQHNKDDIIDVPFTEVQGQEPVGDVLNLEDIAYMVIVGRTKDGETVFRTVGINDLLLIRGLVEYARDEVKAEIAKHRK